MRRILLVTAIISLCSSSVVLERPDVTFKIFQFPPNMIPATLPIWWDFV